MIPKAIEPQKMVAAIGIKPRTVDIAVSVMGRKRDSVPSYKFTAYFENEVMRKWPYLTKEMCIRIVRSPIRLEVQEENRYRFWGRVAELGDRFLRAVTLSDKRTMHNAFLDRRFKL
jgi:hypothetical protein